MSQSVDDMSQNKIVTNRPSTINKIVTNRPYHFGRGLHIAPFCDISYYATYRTSATCDKSSVIYVTSNPISG